MGKCRSRTALVRGLLGGSPMQRMLALRQSSKQKKKKKKSHKRTSPAPQELLPGIPNDLVLDQILPRLPWYQRPVMRSVSRPWLLPAAEHSVPTPSKLTRTGLVFYVDSPPRIEFLDVARGTWHDLPPPPPRRSSRCCKLDEALCMTDGDRRFRKLDISSGVWKWETFEEGLTVRQMEPSTEADYVVENKRYLGYRDELGLVHSVNLPRRLGTYRGEEVAAVTTLGNHMYAVIRLLSEPWRMYSRCTLWEGEGVSVVRDPAKFTWRKLSSINIPFERGASHTLLAFPCC